MTWIALLSIVPVLLGSAAVRPAPSPAPAPVIAFFGDSLTQGLHASSPDRTYRALLMRRLAATRDAGPAVTVIQHPLGLLDDALERLPQVLAARPSLVFLELGHHELWGDASQRDLFESRYADILDRLLAGGAQVIPSTLAWLGYPAGSPEYASALRLNGIVRRLAAERGLVVADLWSPTDLRADLISTPDEPSFIDPYHGDDLHPNDAGQQALADAFWRAYRVLRSRPLLGRSLAR